MTSTGPARGGASWIRSPAGWGVGALLVFTVVALGGYGVFGQNPHLIPASLLWFWQTSYAFFARFHILVGGVALAAALVGWSGVRWVPSLVVVYLLALTAEYVGTGYGIPFGVYEYTSLLGMQIGGQVPWVIPLSWYLMVLPAWIMARQTFPAAGRWVPRIILAAVLLTIWDLALDPAMSYEAPYYWRWGSSGPYYGMPWLNLVGWMGTGIVLMGALELLGIRQWGRAIRVEWAVAYYAVTVLMPLGMLAIKGFWLAVGVTLGACLAAWGVHRLLRPRVEESDPAPAIQPSSPGPGAAGSLPAPDAGALP